MPARKVIRTKNTTGHRNPIPPAIVLGNLILPSVISGGHPKTGLSKDPAEQVKQAFVNMKELVEAGGGGVDTIGKITIYVRDLAYRDFINEEWLAMFPDEDDRPARHVIRQDIQGDLMVQLDVIALTRE